MKWSDIKAHRPVLFFVFLGLTLFHVVFIFSNSLKCADDSNMHSGFFVRFFVENIMRLDFDAQSPEFIAGVTHYVRKLAHFSEFALLSVYCLATLVFYGKRTNLAFFSTVFFCFFIGCIDELLQRFSEGRSCQFSDALLDGAGGLFGAFVFCTVLFLLQKVRKH